MNSRDLAALLLAASTLVGAIAGFTGYQRAGTAQQTTGHVDDSLRACLLTLEHVMEETN